MNGKKREFSEFTCNCHKYKHKRFERRDFSALQSLSPLFSFSLSISVSVMQCITNHNKLRIDVPFEQSLLKNSEKDLGNFFMAKAR